MVVKYQIECGKFFANCFVADHLVYRGTCDLENCSFDFKAFDLKPNQVVPRSYYLFCQRFISLCNRLFGSSESEPFIDIDDFVIET